MKKPHKEGSWAVSMSIFVHHRIMTNALGNPGDIFQFHGQVQLAPTV